MTKVSAIARLVILELCRRKDFYVLFILTVLITLLLGSINFFNDNQVVRYLKEVCLLLVWVSALVMAITTAARQLPAEIENRTIYPLLAKPLTRAQLVVGKFVGCWLASGLVLVVFYLFFALISASREKQLPWISYLQALWMHWQLLGILGALTLLGSVLFTTPAANATILFVLTGGILLLGQHLFKIALRQTEPWRTALEAIYFTMPHLEFFDLRPLIIHNWPARDWAVIGLATFYGWLYTAAFLWAACLAFRRKPLKP
jgi:ABC-type transport system involved in multi-copper enzyme maturation permease subunit